MPANAGIFMNDVFRLEELTASVLSIEVPPTRIAEMGLFESEGVTTTDIAIEEENGKLILVPEGTRGTNGTAMGNNSRKAPKVLRTSHLKLEKSFSPSEYQDIRQFGSAGTLTSLDAAVLKYQTQMKESILATIEYQRLGAIKGVVVDADGTTTIHDLHSIFGITQPSFAMDLTDTNTPLTLKYVKLKRLLEKAINNGFCKGFHVFYGSEFFDEVTGHPTVQDAYKRYMESAFLREDNRKGFYLGGMMHEEYSGAVNGKDFIKPTEAYAFPIGVKGMFLTRYSPADYTATVNTIGLPMYSKEIPDLTDRGRKIEVQSNPINICVMPQAVYKLVM